MAAADTREMSRFDAVEGWPAPEERVEWFGDPAAERALLDAYRGGRMHHAWLIGGPKGIGKATLAYRFARFALAHPDPARRKWRRPPTCRCRQTIPPSVR